MKKFLRHIPIIGLLLCTLACAIAADNFPSIKTPESLSQWLIKNITYELENGKEDYWKTPQETIKDKAGDCEDMAILTRYILKKKGYKVYIIAIEYKDKSSAHAIAVIKHNDKTYSYFDNQFYISKRFNNITELLNYHSAYTSDWKKAWLVLSKYAGLPLWRNK